MPLQVGIQTPTQIILSLLFYSFQPYIINIVNFCKRISNDLFEVLAFKFLRIFFLN